MKFVRLKWYKKHNDYLRTTYSRLPNRRLVPNKRVGGNFFEIVM